ncbi:MAG: hypothetical protein K2F64_02950, partial [Muribaculaceae bacterium]|nr:hypothetical protein [Muribaculaceae bacterium]
LTAILAATTLFSCGGGEDEPENPDKPVVNPDQPDNPGNNDNDNNGDLPELAAQFANVFKPVISDEGYMVDNDVTKKLIGYWSTSGKYNQDLLLLPNGRFELYENGSYLKAWKGRGDWVYNATKSTILLFDANISIEISAFNKAGDKFSGTIYYRGSEPKQFSAEKNQSIDNESFLIKYFEGLYWDNVDAEGKHLSNDSPTMPWTLTGMYGNTRYARKDNCSFLIEKDLIMIVYWKYKDLSKVNDIWWIEKPWSNAPRMVRYSEFNKFRYYIGKFV